MKIVWLWLACIAGPTWASTLEFPLNGDVRLKLQLDLPEDVLYVLDGHATAWRKIFSGRLDRIHLPLNEAPTLSYTNLVRRIPPRRANLIIPNAPKGDPERWHLAFLAERYSWVATREGTYRLPHLGMVLKLALLNRIEAGHHEVQVISVHGHDGQGTYLFIDGQLLRRLEDTFRRDAYPIRVEGLKLFFERFELDLNSNLITPRSAEVARVLASALNPAPDVAREETAALIDDRKGWGVLLTSPERRQQINRQFIEAELARVFPSTPTRLRPLVIQVTEDLSHLLEQGVAFKAIDLHRRILRHLDQKCDAFLEIDPLREQAEGLKLIRARALALLTRLHRRHFWDNGRPY